MNSDPMQEEPNVNSPSETTSADLAGIMPSVWQGRRAWVIRHLLPAAAIVVATALAYLPVASNGFIWDDDSYVTANPNLRSWAGLAAIWTQPRSNPQYYPLVFSTFWVEQHLWGLDPLGYHLVNVALHASSAVVLWLILRRLGAPWALLGGMIFALHPVHAESVAWVTERKNVLSGLFYLLAAAAYLRFDPPQGARRRWGFYPVCAVLFIAALLSKTVTCTLPAALAVVLWWKRARLRLPDLWPLVPLQVIGAAMGLVTGLLEQAHVGAQGSDWAFTPSQRVLIAGQALWFYASKLIFPYRLTFIYPRWQIGQAAWWQYVFPASALAVMVALVLLRRRIGKGVAAGVLVFAGTLVPALGFFNVYPMRFSFVADHFQYLASIGLIGLGSGLLWGLGTRLARVRRAGLAVSCVLAAALVGSLGTLTWRQATIYRDQETLWQDTLSKYPDCWLAHNNLGVLYRLAYNRAEVAGDSATARAYLERAAFHDYHAVRMRSDFPELLCNLAVTYNGLGRYAEAADLLRRALELPPQLNLPDFGAVIHNAMGTALVHLGSVEEGIAHYREAIRLSPYLPHAYNNLAMVLAERGQREEAERLYRQAIAIGPNFFQLHENLGGVLEAKGDLVGAAECYRAALAIQANRGQTHMRLAFVLAKLGQADQAIAEFNESVRLTGPNDQAAGGLIQILKATAGATTEEAPR